MYIGFEEMLYAEFAEIPPQDGGYTANQYFVFENGKVTLQRTLDDPAPVTHDYCNLKRSQPSLLELFQS